MRKDTVTEETHKDSPFFRQIAKSGGSRYLAVTKLIPSDWDAVYIYPIRTGDNEIEFRVRRVDMLPRSNTKG